MAKRRASDDPETPSVGPVPKTDRARYLAERTEDTMCRIHKCPLDQTTGWCPVAQAWWVPRFRCPECAGPLWDNGYCPSCTPRAHTFPGDYFEQRWDAGAGREWGHYVRVSRGPTRAPSPEAVRGYLAELRARIATLTAIPDALPAREPGDEPAWITEDAAHA